jgi:hypothetical protein
MGGETLHDLASGYFKGVGAGSKLDFLLEQN